MLNKKKLLFLSTFIFFLTSCKPLSTHDFLLQHPDVLEKELAYCQNKEEVTPHCDEVKQIAAEFVELSNKQHDNPENFGKEILQLETDVVIARDAMQAAKNSNSDSEKIKNTEEVYQSKLQKLKAYLAVLAETSSPG